MQPRKHSIQVPVQTARQLISSIFIVCSLIPGLLTAQEADTTETNRITSSPSSTPEPGSDRELPLFGSEAVLSLLDQPQKFISSNLHGMTKSLDEFFSDEKAEYESNGSYIRMTGDMVFSKLENPGFAGDIKGRIELPNTQKKLKLVFESDPAEAREELERPIDNNPLDAAQDKSYFAGIERLWGEFSHWKFRSSLGLKLSSRLDSFVRLRANRDYDISEKWNAYLRNTLYWFDSSGPGFDSSLEFDHALNQTLTFRSAVSGGWTEENEYWELSQVFSLTQTLAEREAIIYQAGVYGISEPRVYATDYLLQARYRRQLRSDYLFLELIPKVQYPRTDDFAPFYSFTVRLEMVFKG